MCVYRSSMYKPLWQRWDLVTEHRNAEATVSDTHGVLSSGSQTMREQVQTKRIEGGMSITSVAEAIGTDARVLASFERGDGILGKEVLVRLGAHLNLTTILESK